MKETVPSELIFIKTYLSERILKTVEKNRDWYITVF